MERKLVRHVDTVIHGVQVSMTITIVHNPEAVTKAEKFVGEQLARILLERGLIA